MRLVPIAAYLELRFPLGGPDASTIRRWCRDGHQPGAVRRGKSWFVDLDIEENRTGNLLVDNALNSKLENIAMVPNG